MRLTKACDAPAGATSCVTATRNARPTYDGVGRVTVLDTYTGAGTTLALRTETTYRGDGTVGQTRYSEGTTPTLVDTLDATYDTMGRLDQLKRGATVLSDLAWSGDGTILSRADGDAGAIGTSTFTYDWADRLVAVDLPNTFSGAVPTFAWRADGLLGRRTWDTGAAAVVSYDRAKRPISLARGSDTLGQAYDRDGNVTAESRSLGGVGGDPGSGTQAFTYDALNRVTASSGLAQARSYAYDLDGNRVSKTEGGVTFSTTFERTDQQVSVQKSGGTLQAFSYDPYGNLTGNAETAAAVTAMTYDAADRLTGIDAAGTASDATFTFDALGRFRTRVLAASTDTYSYAGTAETVLRISNSAGPTVTDSIVSPAGDRLGIKQGGTLNWLLPDLHGNVAASLDATETTVVSATRYDAYGMTLATGTAGGTAVGAANWKYQGRLDVSPAGLASPLYDMSARFYAPGLGAFTQFDSVMGSAGNPLSMNRFLYALANPATLIDPSGHVPCGPDGLWCQQDTVAQHAPPYVPPPTPKPPKPKDETSGGPGFSTPHVDDWWNDPYVIGNVEIPDRWTLANAGDLDRLYAWCTSGALSLADERACNAEYVRGLGAIGGEPIDPGDAAAVGQWIPLVDAPADLYLAGECLNQGDLWCATMGTLDVFGVEFAGLLKGPRNAGRRLDLPVGARNCLRSFSPDTAVETGRGTIAIATIEVGDTVTTRDPASGEVAEHAVTAVLAHTDPEILFLRIDGETIETTPDHQFLTEAGWREAAALWPGTRVVTLDGSSGTVEGYSIEVRPVIMWDLTVSDVPTFAVGEGEWVVHNCADLNIGAKVAKQMEARGWTQQSINEAIASGARVRAVNRANGNPATRYVHPTTGQSVVVDDLTGVVIHVGGPGFKYGKGSGDLD